MSTAAARRAMVGWALAMMVIALYTQILLPGAGGAGRGTPAAVLFRGVVFGLINALTAAGIILVYRTLRVINFAQTAIGAAGAILTFNFVQYTAVPFPIAFVLGLGLSALVGVTLDLSLVRRFFHAPRLVLTVVTIVVAGFLSETSAGLVSRLPFFPDADTLTVQQDLGSNPIRDQLPFGGFHFEIGNYALRFGFPEIFAIEVAVLLLLGLAAFFRFTRSGVAVRAMAENTERAALLGISVGRLSTLVWALAGVLAGASVTLIGTVDQPGAAAGFAPSVLLPALAAAVVGRMRSLPTTVFAAVAVSVVSEATRFSLTKDRPLVDLGLLVLIAAGLVLQQRKTLRGGDETVSAWQASEEQRPIPKELLTVPSVRIARRVLIVIGLLVVGIFPFVASTGQTNLGGVIALNAIVALSLVVLTGWAGQVSLGQFAFVAVGGVLGGALTANVGLTFWLAVPLAAALTAGFAVIVGLPALRIRGLFLAVTTFAFAVAVGSLLFEPRYFDWLLPDSIERPTLFFFDFGDERSMYFLCVAALVAAIVVVVNLRKSRFGRVLIALRESEQNVAAFGVAATRTRLVAFAVSGALAGFSGAIFAHQQRGLNADSFGATASIDIFVLAVLGGIGSVNGALLGSLYVNVTKYFITSPLFAGIVGSGGTLLLLYISPGGLVSLVARFRDACLRIVAQRRQMVVPSLFADYDPEALERKLIPLAEASGNSGLGALPPDVRFSLESGLYQGRGVRIFGPVTEPREAKESAAIGAAGKRAAEDEHHANGSTS
ncbi:MAG TPA: ABC transporter permease [Acidimicrobiia bacterium]|nr:ABC transporter permease [Acidimicrobiia bacterium]